jgi:inner membrane protein
MDIAHHALIGGVGYSVLRSYNHELAGLVFMAGSVLPDLDVLFMALGKRFYLKNHQGSTHSLILSPVYALLVAYPLSDPFGFSWFVFFAALTGFWIHYLLDLTNTFGISLIWPFSRKRYSYDAVFFIDSVTWIMTISFFVFSYFFNTSMVFIIYLSSFLSYLILKISFQRTIIKELNCKFAIPSSLNPFEYFILEEADECIKTYLYNFLYKNLKKNVRFFSYPDEKYINMAKKSRVFNDVSAITKLLHITDVIKTKDATTIIANDLGVRNFGGRFGRTILKYDGEGNLINEVANI